MKTSLNVREIIEVSGIFLKSSACHELALRILLQSIESAANRYNRYIEPWVSLSIDFYVRVFVRVYTGAHEVKQSAVKFAHVYQCVECQSHKLIPVAKKVETKNGGGRFVAASPPSEGDRCPICAGRYNIGGPVWGSRLHDQEFLQRIIQQVEEEGSE